MEQIGAGTRITLLRNLRQDRLLCFAVCHSVSFAFQAPLDSHEDMRADRSDKAQAEVTRKLIFHSGGDFFESCFSFTWRVGG